MLQLITISPLRSLKPKTVKVLLAIKVKTIEVPLGLKLKTVTILLGGNMELISPFGDPLIPQIRLGSTVYIEYEVRDETKDPPPLIDPTDSVTINIYRPDGTVAVTAAAMSKVSQGVYSYKFALSDGEQPGFWAVESVAVDTGPVTSKSLLTDQAWNAVA